MPSYIDSFRFPTVRTLLLFWVCSCAVFIFSLDILSLLLGVISASFIEMFGLVSFLADHSFIFSCVKFIQWVVYVVLAISILDIVFIFFIYKILNEVLATTAQFMDLVSLSLRTLPGVLNIHCGVGLVVSLGLLISGAFSPLSVFPSPLNANAAGALISALWACSLAWYCCSFAMKENTFLSFRYGAELLRQHKYFWLLFVLALFFSVWLPGFFAEIIGFDSSVGFVGSFIMVCLGSADILIALCAGLLYFFNEPGAFDIEESNN